MVEENKQSAFTFSYLDWDTNYFGVSSAKAVLHRPLTITEWNELKGKFDDFQFVSIVNQNSEPINAQLLGKNTTSFLIDVNIQFSKSIAPTYEMPENIKIYQALENKDEIFEIADFTVSKFTEDPELAKRGGSHVYHQWLINSFNKENKFFALSKDESNHINGFVLFSYLNDATLIELIASSRKSKQSGIGTRLFKAVEYATTQRGLQQIKVGTQIRNKGAINFYHKIGCRQAECHQVYHLWNL